MPSTAPLKPSAPAVAAVRLRRVVPLAPVAARVRRSLAVSLRMRPTLMARMASARTMPNTVAQSMIVADVGTLDLVSTVMPAAAAARWALWICALVSGLAVWISQPPTPLGPVCRPSVRMACSVITVLGAEVPDGSALISWIGGLARQLLCGHGNEFGFGPGPSGLMLPERSCMLARPDSPGRIVRMSAVGLTWLALIPKACSNCGVATYNGPFQLRPLAAWLSPASVVSSSTTSREPRSVAMACALADSDRNWPGVTVTGPWGPPPWPLAV